MNRHRLAGGLVQHEAGVLAIFLLDVFQQPDGHEQLELEGGVAGTERANFIQKLCDAGLYFAVLLLVGFETGIIVGGDIQFFADEMDSGVNGTYFSFFG